MRAPLLLWLAACSEPIAPTASCRAYVDCLAARDEVLGITTDVVRFADGGACWENPEIAGLCDRGCTSGLAWLRDAEPGLPEACR